MSFCQAVTNLSCPFSSLLLVPGVARVFEGSDKYASGWFDEGRDGMGVRNRFGKIPWHLYGVPLASYTNPSWLGDRFLPPFEA